MKYVLDTDHVIFYFNGHHEVSKAIQSCSKQQLAITRLTHAELLYGAYKSKKVSQNLSKITAFIREMKVLEFTEKAAHVYAQTKAELASMGKPCPSMDLLIASVALSNRAILVTNNTRDFGRIKKLKLENWTTP